MSLVPARLPNGTNFQVFLAESARPITPDLFAGLMLLANAEAEAVSARYIQARRESRALATQDMAKAERDWSRGREALRRAEQMLPWLPCGSWFAGAVLTTSAVITAGAEVALNLNILPWMTGVASHTLEAALLSAAPAAVPILLEQVWARVFDVTRESDDPPVPSSAWRAALARLWRTTPIIAASLLSIYSLWLLAEVRPVMMAVLTDSSIERLTSEQVKALQEALKWMSISLAVAGGVLYVLGAGQFRTAWRHWRARRDVDVLAKQFAASDARYHSALARLQVETDEWADVENTARRLGEAYRAECQASLALSVADPGSLRERVERTLWKQPMRGLHDERPNKDRLM